MIKNFKFLRGDENEIHLISQNEWNRRRDALTERIRQEEIRRENDDEFKIMTDNLIKSLEEPKLSLWTKIFLKIKTHSYIDNISFYLVLIGAISIFIYGLYTH